MGRQKYKTEEERLEAKRESMRKWREKNAERIKQYNKQYHQDNREKIAEQHKQWYQNNPEYNKQYYQDNKDKEVERIKKYHQKNREKILEYNKQYSKQYYKTPMGRALYMTNAYKQEDKKHNRGECTLTAQWIVDNIFSSKCVYCGESDWKKLGCDRIDNSLPHTLDNVVCCCGECNKKRGTKPFEEFLNEIR